MQPQSPTENRRWVLANRPPGAPTPEDFRLERGPVPEPGEGEMLLATVYLSLDPYMRGRMSDAPSYAPPVEIGGVMVGQTVSRVTASNHSRYAVGDLVVGNSGWQDYAVSDGKDLARIPPGAKPTWGLGVLGMPGFTGWYGLTQIGEPKAGETLVVAAATGAVGSVVGQVARQKGCRAVGIAGGPDKCAFAVKELGFDACVDHRDPDMKAKLAAACPDGIDIYFENVGGAVLLAVLPLLNEGARIPLCGVISQYSGGGGDSKDRSGQLMRTFLTRKVKLQGFIVADHYALFGQFLAEMVPWLQAGKIRYREDIVQGLEAAPGAFIGLLEGANFGKLLVQVAPEA
jgi:NADPH-dependent curcumin reductase